jgi:hypothetical protein
MVTQTKQMSREIVTKKENGSLLCKQRGLGGLDRGFIIGTWKI